VLVAADGDVRPSFIGGFGGGWEWREVARLLQAEGNEVIRTTLTGLGERSHLATRR